MRKHLFYTVLFMPQNFEAEQEPINKQTSNFFDKKKTFSLLQNSMKIFIQLGKFSSCTRHAPPEFKQHCPATGKKLVNLGTNIFLEQKSADIDNF